MNGLTNHACLLFGGAFLQSLKHYLGHQRMQSQRRAEREYDRPVPGSQFLTVLFQIAHDVFAGREKVGEHQHARHSLRDAGRGSVGNRRLSQFQVRHFHRTIAVQRPQPVGQVHEIVIGGSAAAAVRMVKYE